MKEKVSFTLEGEEYSFTQNTELINELFWALGATLAEIQVFETGIIFLLSALNSESKPFKYSQEKYGSKTLGTLLNELYKVIPDQEMKNLLKVINDDRNYIAHNILRHYGWPVMSEAKYKYAIKEILEIRHIIHESGPLLTKYVKSKKILELIDIETIYENVEDDKENTERKS